MGWLSFLSKKSPVNDLGDDLKAQAYDETIAASPPICGTYPVAGNGPSILEKFQKSHPHLRETHLNHLNDVSAPPPVVPRLADRPSTAPTNQGSARPKSQSSTITKPRLREPPKKRHGPYKLPSKISDERNDDILNNNLIYTAPSPKFNRDRNSSIFSGDSGSTRRFVDLLDAQSSIKPANFYGRVRATGTKDYDEDVADRNIRENGFAFGSVQAQESHAEVPTIDLRDADEVVDGPRSSRKRHTMISASQSKPASFKNDEAFPRMVPLQLPRDTVKPTQRAPRRKSLHSFVPPSSSDIPNVPIRKDNKGVNSDYLPNSPRKGTHSMARGDHEYSLSTETKPVQSPRKTHPTSGYEQEIDSDSSYHTHADPNYVPSKREPQYQSPKDPSRRRTLSNISPTSTNQPLKRGSIQTLPSSSRREPVSEIGLPSAEESLRGENDRNSMRRHHGTVPGIRDAFYELPPLQPIETYKLKSNRSRPNSKDELMHRDHNRSIASMSAKSSKRSGITDTVPERGSSIRRWSLTSETAGSTMSSNPFRPQSGHTTNTSVDLAPHVLLSKTMDSGQAPLSPGDERMETESQSELEIDESPYQEVDPDTLAGSLANSGRRRRSTDLTLEEDALSVDSFEAPQRPECEFEKDLLFHGYGFEGSQLPGLPGLFDAALPKTESSPSERTKTLSAFRGSYNLASFSTPSLEELPHTREYQYSSRSLPYTSLPRSSRFRKPILNYTDSEDDDTSELEYDSEEDLNFDIPLKRSGASQHDSYSGRRRYEDVAEPIREGGSEYPDAGRVAVLRREAKAKQRASGVLPRKAKGKGRAADIRYPRIGLDDPFSYADVES
ncbi:uncharacterized protein F4822DRAFT_410415 [Hypoxylon trugodes]|uniref:uncharacterized protein n=1 Tax=Hypoxylon trugodes TaxID=326681 RepID=UPI002194753F|nr:uncharacterized protein F4822DRAFT_410415 [Hypoxylon trugodes]KAI1386539.1 hypothetical protein F4822DRAFT_410415 [Hypoxylon trugodes]